MFRVFTLQSTAYTFQKILVWNVMLFICIYLAHILLLNVLCGLELEFIVEKETLQKKAILFKESLLGFS